jgi:class 3 adenylate cyclase
VKAVESAFRIKRDLAERNAGLPEERQLRFRIGLNLGDVTVEEGISMARASTSRHGSRRLQRRTEF